MHAPHERTFPLIDAHASRVHRNGQQFFEVTASALTHATPPQAWSVLTDYGHLDEFVPELRASAVLSRNGREAIVEQRSESGFLFVSHAIHLVLRVTEEPFSAIDVTLVEGDMRHYAVRWELAPAMVHGEQGTRIAFSGAMEPDFFIPPLVGRPIVQAHIRKMLEAVMAEIARRSRH